MTHNLQSPFVTQARTNPAQVTSVLMYQSGDLVELEKVQIKTGEV